jgi:hypothetical protein
LSINPITYTTPFYSHSYTCQYVCLHKNSEFFAEVIVQIQHFWVMIPYRLRGGYRSFWNKYCLLLQGVFQAWIWTQNALPIHLSQSTRPIQNISFSFPSISGFLPEETVFTILSSNQWNFPVRASFIQYKFHSRLAYIVFHFYKKRALCASVALILHISNTAFPCSLVTKPRFTHSARNRIALWKFLNLEIMNFQACSLEILDSTWSRFDARSGHIWLVAGKVVLQKISPIFSFSPATFIPRTEPESSYHPTLHFTILTASLNKQLNKEITVLSGKKCDYHVCFQSSGRKIWIKECCYKHLYLCEGLFLISW